MAGNKFRTFRNKEDSKEQKKADIEKESNIILRRNYEILTKPKEDEKYRSKEILKQGTTKKVIDIIQNEDNTYIKILNKDNNFRYIPLNDNNGNYIIKKYESIKNKGEKNNHKSKIETFGSIRLCDSKEENEENRQEDLNPFKKPNELMFKMISFVCPKIFNLKYDSQENSNISNISSSYTNDNNKNNNIENISEPFYVNDVFNQEYKKNDNQNLNENKDNNNNNNNIFNSIKRVKQNYCETYSSKGNKSYESNKTQTSFEIPSLSKTIFVTYYLLKRELNKQGIELKNLPLEPKYDKGIQVIYMPLKITPDYFYEKAAIGHIFVRYYDKKKGIDKIIESNSEDGKNVISFSDFKKEDLETYNVLEDHELLCEENYFENVAEILNKKYNKNGRLIRGEYSLKNNCCFHTAMEVVTLFGKSDEYIKEIYEKRIRFIAPVVDGTLKSGKSFGSQKD